MSQLKKCVRVPSEILSSPIEEIPLEQDLSYEEHPIKILDSMERVTRNQTIKFYKVQWSNHIEDEATWEQESYLKSKYPDFQLPSQGTSSFPHVLPCS